ncbi:cysteine proteinase [Massarina eburnea CBS 473.64]|uniref:Cysteine proteinase n=1 Tax=Massarina eburnea CBS 473.64 TaxID=1395130 RepID=A0A6A6S0C9_9PLEO|nr:cysteine proteinase [Massarina eburnea CBS 473.64]
MAPKHRYPTKGNRPTQAQTQIQPQAQPQTRSIPRITPLQLRRTKIANKIRKTWPIARTKTYDAKTRRRKMNKDSRGMTNSDIVCNRNALLQVLLHLPKFCNWVLEHKLKNAKHVKKDNKDAVEDETEEGNENHDKVENERETHDSHAWFCNTGFNEDGSKKDPNYWTPKAEDIPDSLIPDHSWICVACLMKNLIEVYWCGIGENGSDGEDEDEEGTPSPTRPLSQNLYPLSGIHDSAIRWRLQGIPNQPYNVRLVEKESQQAADEFLTHFLDALECSIDQTAHPDRYEQMQSLFYVSKNETGTCTNCAHPVNKLTSHMGLDIVPLLSKRQSDSIDAAVARDMADHKIEGVNCENCYHTADRDVHTTIEAGPEYLVVRLQLTQYNQRTGQSYKNTNPVRIDPVLDLTQYTTSAGNGPVVPLRYRPIGIVFHAGAIDGGHYVSKVTGPEKKFFINDDSVMEIGRVNDKGALLENPYQGGFNAYLVVYGKMANERGRSGRELEGLM